ncbi:hypothetical protein COCMIDRAFT_90493 [Bipolaris oryzae ATCC 44560]|uniref:Uncharacterized protein n=1 Tax=Bipolaris oryzae ATCC 44560 TaxID=930090 RepID=W6ZBV2_COCMI|nr:uncharacterized protein COCMIDRAFT_90493 [Bipolaris oryzae ATCC 44560]EUC47288.1 hypothetical protein COCMIDRAFT_90493 [Bipolaris oryzae ATCC 44560]
MHLSLLFIFFLNLLTTALTAPNSPALAPLEGLDTSTILYTPTPTLIHAFDAAITAKTNTHADNSNDNIANNANANLLLLPTQTITQTARVTQTSRPQDPEPIILYPFHLTLTSACSSSSSSYSANATLTNGNWTSRIINLTSSTRAIVDHHISGYPQTFSVGPFEAPRGELRFGYLNGEGGWRCEWGDGDKDKNEDGERSRGCGWCKGGEWRVAGCKRGWGIKEMDCEFIMGWRHQLKAEG